MLFKILFIGASATTGIFAGLWLAERDETKRLNTRLNASLKVYREAYQRALSKMTTKQVFALMEDTINDIKFDQIVHNQ